jgi:hypothetical protein
LVLGETDPQCDSNWGCLQCDEGEWGCGSGTAAEQENPCVEGEVWDLVSCNSLGEDVIVNGYTADGCDAHYSNCIDPYGPYLPPLTPPPVEYPCDSSDTDCVPGTSVDPLPEDTVCAHEPTPQEQNDCEMGCYAQGIFDETLCAPLDGYPPVGWTCHAIYGAKAVDCASKCDDPKGTFCEDSEEEPQTQSEQ